MTPERLKRIEAVYRSALEREPSRQDASLSEACLGDVELRGEIETLLQNKAVRRKRSLIPVRAYKGRLIQIEVGKDGRIVMPLGTFTWYSPAGLFDPATGRLTPIKTDYVTDIHSIG